MKKNLIYIAPKIKAEPDCKTVCLAIGMRGFGLFLLGVLLCATPQVSASNDFSGLVDIRIIQKIESNGDPLAYNEKERSRGLYQIREITLDDYNNYHREKIEAEKLFHPQVCERVARWYLFIRIPQMLRYYKHEVNTRNIIIAYNAGISRVGKRLPKTTENYLKKYSDLGGDLCLTKQK